VSLDHRVERFAQEAGIVEADVDQHALVRDAGDLNEDERAILLSVWRLAEPNVTGLGCARLDVERGFRNDDSHMDWFHGASPFLKINVTLFS
jgi:hypothetical protein